MNYQPIENYGIIGDLNTVALVGMNGSIDFMCFPYFDSPSIFAALLDDERGGRFSITPQLEKVKHRQLYLPDTNILLTRFLSPGGIAEISDFMPIEGESGISHNLIRRAKCVHGEVTFRMLCQPRFNYARSGHHVEQNGCEVLFVSEDQPPTALRLISRVPVKIVNGSAVAEFTLRAGESTPFILEEAREGTEAFCDSDHIVSDAFKQTSNYWHKWIGRCKYSGRWREMVYRSALTLKLLVSQRHGSIVAAPTFGLPELIGGARNWDYRFTWIRDASFTLYALIRLGYTEEAQAFMRWIKDRCEELEPGTMLQVMYATDGSRNLTEIELPHLRGYKNSSPVRVGNRAHVQLQLDIYGELMDSVYLFNKFGDPIPHDMWVNLAGMIDWICENWQQPDEGIWEVRGGRREFLISRMMCWVAIDRGIRLAWKRSFPAPLERWVQVRDLIYHDIFANFWNPDVPGFVQYKGSDNLDAGTLLMPLMKFMSPTDPRWLQTMKSIEERLIEDSLVYRYRHGKAAPDGLSGADATFNMCTFWYVECISRSGDVDKARFIFEKMLGYANHLGLYGEEMTSAGEHLGNFPQAFTHLALISAATNLDQRLKEFGRAD